MADAEHVAVLRQGIPAWNTWRFENFFLVPNLGGADLRGLDLRQIDLRECYLGPAWVESRGDSDEASLVRTNLAGCDLSGSELVRADLSLAILNGANLSSSDLSWADLSRADLDWADLSYATIGGTIFADTDLSLVTGLDTVKHRFPSSIGVDTLCRSRCRVPNDFLRGACVPQGMIAAAGTLVPDPDLFHSCFISYSFEDELFTRRLYADLDRGGVRCWFAPRHLRIGEKFRCRIDESIRAHDKMLLVLSAHSIRSAWVEKEVETAFEEERTQNTLLLFPITVDDEVWQTQQAWAADIRRTRHIGDFRNWRDRESYQKAFERLLRDLKEQSGAS